jgi:CheY-like chemotaxis protein
MNKILIIGDDNIVANLYRNKLAVEGYQTEGAADGETGLKVLRTFQPQLVILDLMLPTISGVEVIKAIRSDPDFVRLPVIVFFSTNQEDLIQSAWRAGANKCLSKSSCTPKDFIEIVRHTLNDQSTDKPVPAAAGPTGPARTANGTAPGNAGIQTGLSQTFIDNLPATLYSLRSGLQAFIKAGNEADRLKQVNELYRQVHVLNGYAGLAGFAPIAHMASAFEALLKGIYEKPKNINASTSRTIAAAVDFLGVLFNKGTQAGQQKIPASNILVVDDEAISRCAVVYALEKARLHSVNVEDPQQALQLLKENDFDLIFLDVDMPGMTGFELCAKLRTLPRHKKTPVVFVTSLNDFDSRTTSTMAGGNDFICKPFLFTELTVKALIYVLRAKLNLAESQPR